MVIELSSEEANVLLNALAALEATLDADHEDWPIISTLIDTLEGMV